LHDAALNPATAAVDEAHPIESRGGRRVDVLFDH